MPPGESVVIDGHVIPHGMLHVGRPGLIYGDPAVIVPGPPVGCPGIDHSDPELPLWPSYSTLSPSCRGTYLEWLAGGRHDAAIDIGFAFLFFYGLERRLLREADLCSSDEIVAILAEAERLRGLYGSSASFSRYVGSFVAAMRATLPGPRLYDGPPPTATDSNRVLLLRAAVAQAAADGRPLPAAWAAAWCAAVHPPPRWLSRPAREFRRLFAARHDPFVLAVPHAAPLLEVTYRTASSALPTNVTIKTPLPDVWTAELPEPLAALATACDHELRPYMRARRCRTDVPRSALLPCAVAPAAERRRRVSLAEWLENIVPSHSAVLVDAAEVLERWLESPPSTLRTHEAEALAIILAGRGFGMDPDPRFGDGAATQRIALFRQPPDAPSAPTENYAAAASIVHLAAAVASADDLATRGDRDRVEAVVQRMDGVSPGLRPRLRARAVRLFEERTPVRGAARPLMAFSPGSRARIGGLLVRVAAVDGRPGPRRVALLLRLFEELGLDPAAVYTQAHAVATDTVPATAPVVVRRLPREAGPTGFRIPPANAIDEDRLAQRQAEADDVQALLSGIFADPEDEADVPTDPSSLDPRHRRLGEQLARRAAWSRAEFETLCRDLDLFPDGALETLNDAAYAIADIPALEGDDPVHVDQELLRRITQ